MMLEKKEEMVNEKVATAIHGFFGFIKEKEEIEKKAYEKYQLDWMMSHGYSLADVFSVCKEAAKTQDITSKNENSMEEYFSSRGFDGEIFTSPDKFFDAEYEDIRYMKSLLNHDEFIKYLKARRIEDYTYFTVDGCGLIDIIENGCISDSSVTEDQVLTSRITNYKGANFQKSDLIGDDEEDYDMIDEVLSCSRQYTDDVTDEDFYESIYDLLDTIEGLKEVSGYSNEGLIMPFSKHLEKYINEKIDDFSKYFEERKKKEAEKLAIVMAEEYKEWFYNYIQKTNGFSDMDYDEENEDNIQLLSYFEQFCLNEAEKENLSWRVSGEDRDFVTSIVKVKYKDIYFSIETLSGQGCVSVCHILKRKPRKYVEIF